MTVCAGSRSRGAAPPGWIPLLTWAFRAEAARIAFQTGHPVWVSIHGHNHRVTQAAVNEYELSGIVNHLYGADGMARLQGGNDFDTAYAIPINRWTRLRFRLNATPTRTFAARRRQCRAAADCRYAAVTRRAAGRPASSMPIARVRGW